MGDGDVQLQIAILDMFQEFGQIPLRVRLAHVDGEAFFKRVAKHECLDKAGMDARPPDVTTAPRCGAALAQARAAADLCLDGGGVDGGPIGFQSTASVAASTPRPRSSRESFLPDPRRQRRAVRAGQG